METNYLLSNRFNYFGWILITLSVILWSISLLYQDDNSFLKATVFTIAGSEGLKSTEYFTLIDVNLTFTIVGVLFILGGMFVAFAKQKTEDEFIMKLRLLSFQWSILINYSLLLFCFLFIYDLAFLNIMIYNMFTILILFIIRFHYLLYKYNDSSNEK
jgi:hypothetical protein